MPINVSWTLLIIEKTIELLNLATASEYYDNDF